MPEIYMMFTDTVLVFDNVRQTLKIIANVPIEEFPSTRTAYASAQMKIDEMIERLRAAAVPPCLEPSAALASSRFAHHLQRNARGLHGDGGRGEGIYRRRRHYPGRPVAALRGAARRRIRSTSTAACARSIRRPTCSTCGSAITPWSAPRRKRWCAWRVGEITLRPIAGTRRRGATEAEDRALERELLADPKERAEHIMLVDLGRNDVGRVAKIGSVKVSELMTVERYSHVMHIVSNVRRRTARRDATPSTRFARPFRRARSRARRKSARWRSSTNSNRVRRGVYAGAVGYFSYTGNTDTAIALRTLLVKNDRVYIQAGGGVVADSDPGAEYRGVVSTRRARWFRALGAAREFEAAGQAGTLPMSTRILMIDNYDSFTYNLVQYLGELGAEVTVRRNDAIDVAGARALDPERDRDFAGALHSHRSRHLCSDPARNGGRNAHARRMPGPSMHRRGLRRSRWCAPIA